MRIEFWGVRGSVAVSGPQVARAGGNTSCVVVTADNGAHLVLDGGTGLQAFGQSLGPAPADLAILFSHVHWDHVQGVPFFMPAFHPGSQLRFVGARRPWGGVREGLTLQMRPPGFPIGLDALAARLDFRDVGAGERFEDGPFTITTAELHHPNGSMAYRVEADGQSLVYATDNELGAAPSGRLVEATRGVDLLIHDAQYTPDELCGRSGPARKGWGHSTWQEAVELGESAGVGRLALFHHDPARTDDELAVLEARAQSRHGGVFAAREGRVLDLGADRVEDL